MRELFASAFHNLICDTSLAWESLVITKSDKRLDIERPYFLMFQLS
jgi:hypothetical protein